jgi:hypothetical protein
MVRGVDLDRRGAAVDHTDGCILMKLPTHKSLDEALDHFPLGFRVGGKISCLHAGTCEIARVGGQIIVVGGKVARALQLR